MKYPIGTMSSGDILSRGFGLLFSRFALFYTIMLIVELPILALRLALPDFMSNAAGLGVLLILTLVLQTIGTGAMIRVVMQEYLDRPVSFGEAFSFALSRFGALLVTSFISGILITLGFLACLIPGIYLSIVFSLATSVVIVEGRVGMGALSRSKDLVTGYFGRVFGLFFLLGLMDRIAEGGIAVLGATALPYSTVDRFGTLHINDYGNYAMVTSLETVVQIFFLAYIAVCTTLLYFDLRNRKETFDLELEAEKLSAWAEHFRPRKHAESQDIQLADPGIQPPGVAVPPNTDIQPSPKDVPPPSP